MGIKGKGTWKGGMGSSKLANEAISECADMQMSKYADEKRADVVSA